MDSVELLASLDPAVSYRAHRRLAGATEDDPAQQRRRQQVARSDNVRMLTGRRPDGSIRHGDIQPERDLATAGRAAGAYRKWQGPHRTLAELPELGNPAGDASPRPVVEQVHDWLFAPRHLKPPSTHVFPGPWARTPHGAQREMTQVRAPNFLALPSAEPAAPPTTRRRRPLRRRRKGSDPTSHPGRAAPS